MGQHYKILLDTPAQQPALGFNDYADALASVIHDSDPRFAVGIFGGWGSGKTTLMQAIAQRLNPQQVIAVHFSAWRYEKEQHLIVPLLDTLRAALIEYAQQQPAAETPARNAARTVVRVIRSLLAGFSLRVGLPGAVEASFDANAALEKAEALTEEDKQLQVSRSFYHASFKALRDTFRDFLQLGGRRIVVFVDDLDRCLPQGALEVLESMKLFFDLNGFVFVVGLDRAVVEACIEAKYQSLSPAAGQAYAQQIGQAVANALAPSPETTPAALSPSSGGFRVRGADYIKKIFQIPFQLAPVAVSQLDDFMQAIYAEGGLPVEQIQEFQNVVQPHLSFLVTDSGVNPREVKRFLNAYTLQRKIKPHLHNQQAILALQTITFRPDWSEVIIALYGWRHMFLDALKERVRNNKASALTDLDPSWASIPESFLAYVSPGGAGEALLDEANLDEYIYSGEATRSGIPPDFIDTIRDLVKMRDILRHAETARTPQQHLGDESTLALDQLLALLSLRTGSLQSYSQGVAGRLALQSLSQLMDEVQEIRPSTPAERFPVNDAWFERQHQTLSRTLGHLRELYRSGDFSGSMR